MNEYIQEIEKIKINPFESPCRGLAHIEYNSNIFLDLS